MKAYMRMGFRRYFGDGDGGTGNSGTGTGTGGNSGTGTGTGTGGNGSGGTGGSGSGGSGGNNAPPQTFTQDQVNAFLAEDRRKAENKNKELIAQLETLKASENLSKKQQEELQAQIDSMQKQYMTKEQLEKEERDKEIKKLTEESKKAAETAERWKNDYTKLRIDNEIIRASTEHGAYSNEQMITYLTPRTELTTEVGEDGKPTGKLIPMVNLEDKDDKGKDIVLKLSVSDAVKRMKELPERFGNLFKGEGVGGVGTLNRPGGTGGGNGTAEGFRSDMTPAEYKAWRKSQPFSKKPGVLKRT